MVEKVILRQSWAGTLRAIQDRRVVALLFLGFSAGLPILLVFSTLSVWLREAEVSRATIGFFSWAALGYAFKFVWAPVIDALPVPLLTRRFGRRRGWLLISQAAVIGALVAMALTDPLLSLTQMAAFAVLLGFSSATQDVIIDAYRIEVADEELQGLLSAAYITGYRMGMLIAGAGALEIAGIFGEQGVYSPRAWSVSYLIMAGAMLVGVATTLLVPEPNKKCYEPGTEQSAADYARFCSGLFFALGAFVVVFFISADFTTAAKGFLAMADGPTKGLWSFTVEAVRLGVAVSLSYGVVRVLIAAGLVPRAMVESTYVAPFKDFFSRYGRTALLIIALISTYRIADVVMGVMANVFYVDIGFEKQEIGRITKGFGLIMTIVGGFFGGILTIRFGVMRILFLGAVLAAATNLLFAVMAGMGNDIRMLIAVISADNLSAGIASAAFVAYLASLTNSTFTATQYALFSSIMLLLPKLLAGYSGVFVETVGYTYFFIGTAVMGLPALVLIVLVVRLRW